MDFMIANRAIAEEASQAGFDVIAQALTDFNTGRFGQIGHRPKPALVFRR